MAEIPKPTIPILSEFVADNNLLDTIEYWRRQIPDFSDLKKLRSATELLFDKTLNPTMQREYVMAFGYRLAELSLPPVAPISCQKGTCCEFRLITSHNQDADRFLCKLRLPALPAPGETINLNGHPFVVVDRGWAASTEQNMNNRNPPLVEMWCYFRVSCLQTEQVPPGF